MFGQSPGDDDPPGRDSGMISPELQALVQYRLTQATEAIESARLLVQNRHLRDATNRSYYAMFYATLALLAYRGKRASKHTGVLSLFDIEFVRTGLFSKQYSDWFHRAFDLRQDSDYREMFQVSEQGTEEVLIQAEAFVAEVKSYLSRER